VNSLFAACAPGLEPLVASELAALGVKDIHPTEGGVGFAGEHREMALANNLLGCASRVLLRLGAFHAAAFPELRRKAAALPWDTVLTPGAPMALRVTAHKSRLFHSGAIAERVAGAVADALGKESPVEKSAEDAEDVTAQTIIVRMHRDECTISADSSGALLHRRGYRQATGKAPLRETLACAMLAAAGWKPGEALLDPFCGSGTIILEAARMASGMPPGIRRNFAFISWPRMPGDILFGINGGPAVPTPIAGSDINHGALAAARANAERAAFSQAVQISRGDAVDITPHAPTGLILTNPPYGHRVGDSNELHALFAAFGRNLRARFGGWRVAMLTTDDALIRSTGLLLKPVLKTSNGGLRVTLHLGQVDQAG